MPIEDAGADVLHAGARQGGMVVLVGGFWLDVLGFLVVIVIVFVLVELCERERH